MAQIKITQIKSRINCLRKMPHTVVKEDTPSIRGMIKTVHHLVEVTNI